MILQWREIDNYLEAQLGTATDGVTFTLTHHPTCYRRGPWRLLVEVCSGRNHQKWGCFDAADQPMRYYHLKGNALSEAEAIAAVLWKDRHGAKFPTKLAEAAMAIAEAKGE